MNRSVFIVAALVGLVVLAPAAYADSGSGDTSTTSAPPVTEAPMTETPVTETPVTTTTTEVPATEAPATTTTTTTTVPVTTGTPITTGTTIPEVDTCVADCIPTTEDCVECVPGVGGGIPNAVAGAGALPFTGIEDMIAPILLALTVALGGVVAWRWAQLRESVAIDAGRARPLPAREAGTGYATALRNHVIEQRARRVFTTPRVA